MIFQGKGKIINISSMQSFLSRSGDPAYPASKSAINLMTMSMACELGAQGICVNAIAPTWCWSDLARPILEIKEFYHK